MVPGTSSTLAGGGRAVPGYPKSPRPSRTRATGGHCLLPVVLLSPSRDPEVGTGIHLRMDEVTSVGQT